MVRASRKAAPALGPGCCCRTLSFWSVRGAQHPPVCITLPTCSWCVCACVCVCGVGALDLPGVHRNGQPRLLFPVGFKMSRAVSMREWVHRNKERGGRSLE